MKVICISGKAGHGKDTAALYLKEQLELGDNSVLIAHFGDLVKYVCTSFFDWDGQKNEAGRELLQTVGTDIVRDADPDYWARFICDMLEFFPKCWDYVILPDLRFENELDLVVKTCMKSGFHVTHMRIIRDNYVSDMTEEQQIHISETALDDYPPDIYVHNSGYLGEFYDNLLIAMDELKL